MNLKTLLLLVALSVPAICRGQGLSAVMVDSNGVVQRPANFAQANFLGAGSVQHVTFANLLEQKVNAAGAVSNSIASGSIANTVTNGVYAVRLIGAANSRVYSGVGTDFGLDSHKAWVTIQSVLSDNGVLRVVLGQNSLVTTNIAIAPTNRAVGAEIETLSGDTNRIRLIAHNGSAYTEGPWVTLGSLHNKYVVGIEQTKGSGEVKLWVGTNAAPPVVNTDATISGGPTANAPLGHSAFDIGLFTDNTNASGNAAFTLYGARLEVTD